MFFILSGFVVPINYFRRGRDSAIRGGLMRRYFRLMIPLIMVLSLYYLVVKFDLMGESTFNKIKHKTFLNLIYASTLETFVPGGGMHWVEPTWTIGVDYWGTYVALMTAFVGHSVRGRYFLYIAFIFFWISIEFLGFLNLIPWD